MKRLTEELPDGFARQLLESAESDVPSRNAAQRALAVAAGSMAMKSAAGSFVAAKIGLAVLAAAVVGGAGVVEWRRAHAAADSKVAIPTVMRAAPAAPVTPVETVENDEAVPPVAAAAPAVPRHRSTAVRSQPQAPVAPVAPPAEVAATAADDLREQVNLVDRARALVQQGDPQGTSLLDAYARRWPNGAFALDAALLAIEGDRRSGHAAEARARADRFMTAHPAGAYRARVLRALNVETIP